MKYLISLSVLLLLFATADAQYYLKGQVKDEKGNLLQNVSIRLQSTGYIYYTGGEGAFGIASDKNPDTLLLSLDGYQKKTTAVNANSFSEIILKKSMLRVEPKKRSSLIKNLTRESQEQWLEGDETYASLVENQFIEASSYPSTALSLNIDKASYSNIRRFLNNGQVVPPDAIRLEEMVNYFNLNYEPPPADKVFEIKTILTGCPWNKGNELVLARITSKKADLSSLPPSNLVFLIDVSGSMDMPNRLPMIKSALKTLVNNLRDQDSVSIVVYGGWTGVALPCTGGGNKEKIFKTLDSLQAYGDTPGASGISIAYQVARQHYIKAGNNRIILATDGDFNVGAKSEDELEALVNSEKKSGVYLSCLGLGMGNYKDSKIQILAQAGNGNFAYLDSYAEADKVLMKEFAQTLYAVADDAFLNISFDPSIVKRYRIVGFDNKLEAIKDASSIIEGGEIGSGWSTLIAIEINPVSPTLKYQPSQPLSFNLKYQLPHTNKTDEVYQQPLLSFRSLDSIDQSYKMAASVLLFGSLLRKSKYNQDSNWNDLIELATSSADLNNYSQKELVSLIRKAKIIYGKKKRDKDQN